MSSENQLTTVYTRAIPLPMLLPFLIYKDPILLYTQHAAINGFDLRSTLSFLCTRCIIA